MANIDRKQKIVVLGGGVSAMTAVFEITSQPDWQQKYDITVYQMGWRLGGKGASGRRMTEHQRIEEHGLHIWFGFYENAFNLMYRCYNELQRSPNAPLNDVYSAFVGQDKYVFMEHVGDDWIPWEITVPHNDDFPGIPLDPDKPNSVPEIPPIWDYIQLALSAANQLFISTILPDLAPTSTNNTTLEKPSWWERIEQAVIGELKLIAHDIEIGLLERALEFAKILDTSLLGIEHDHEALVWLLAEFRRWLSGVMDELSLQSTPIRRAWILIDLALTGAIGMIHDQIFSKGFDVINHLDFREWLIKHGISDTALESGFIRSLYDIVFGYVNGDVTQPSVEAGSMLRSALRLAFTYRGHVLYKMQAGMGDAIFAPLYEVLKFRGVKFEFFHKVTKITSNADNTRIASLTIARQADLTVGEYNPLLMVKELPCWPSNPIYEQLVQGNELREKNINLESRWADWDNVGEIVLTEDNNDFDHIILGISLAALPFICDERIWENEKWRLMRANIQTVQTQAAQIWFKPDAKELSWLVPEGLLASFREPLASWADLSELIARENWIPGSTKGLFYTTGVMQDDGKPIPPPDQHDYPESIEKEVKDRSIQTLQDDAPILFPNAVDANGKFKWDLLAAEDIEKDEQRFNSQYWRANVDPTERYVLTVKDTSQYRLTADNSEFENMTVTGTWVNNGLNLSCVEAAAMSGMAASRAITGKPTRIVGDNDTVDS